MTVPIVILFLLTPKGISFFGFIILFYPNKNANRFFHCQSALEIRQPEGC
jgi:hypothetical protein